MGYDLYLKFEENEFIKEGSNGSQTSLSLYHTSTYSIKLKGSEMNGNEKNGLSFLIQHFNFLEKVEFLVKYAPEVALDKNYVYETKGISILEMVKKDIIAVQKGIATFNYLSAMGVKCWVTEE